MFDKSLDISVEVRKQLMSFLLRYADKRVADASAKELAKLLFRYFIVLEANANPYTL